MDLERRAKDRVIQESLLRNLLEAVAAGSVCHLLADPASETEVLRVMSPLAAVEDRVVAWVAVNQSRVDAGLTSAAADAEWRLVYFITAGSRISSVHLYERPPPFEGVPGGRAIVINGPSGAGKSTLMTAILDSADEPWVMFDEPVMGHVARQPYLIWRDRAPRLHRGYFQAIAALASEGNHVVFSAAGFPFALVEDVFEAVPTLYVGLDCPLDVLLQREAGREGRWGGIAEESLGAHEGWTYDVRFDTSSESATAIAAKTLALVPSSVPL